MSTYLIRFGSMNIGKFEADGEDAAIALFLDQCCFESLQGAAREYGVDPKDIEVINVDDDPRFVRI